MKQSARVRPEPTVQRKAIIASGGVQDHAGSVTVHPIPDFDLDRTIFQTLEGSLARYVMKVRVGKEVRWSDAAAATVQDGYDGARKGLVLPDISPALLTFMVEECDFDVEHADGSFLDHLYFGFEYSAQHYPEQSPLVMLLHSILGTGTNTFAMDAAKISTLQALVSPEEWRQVEAFPSVLRLLYHGPLRDALRNNTHRASSLSEVRFHRVIDNAPITMSGEEFWVQLNYQLIHLLDFLPVANWSTHANDTAFIIFRDLLGLMEQAGKRQARISYTPSTGSRRPQGEARDLGSWLTSLIPVRTAEKMAGKSIAQFSARIGHSLHYEMSWT